MSAPCVRAVEGAICQVPGRDARARPGGVVSTSRASDRQRSVSSPMGANLLPRQESACQSDSPPNTGSAADTVTILRTTGRLLATKRVEMTANGPVVHGYDLAKHFSVHAAQVVSLNALMALLDRTGRDRQSCTMRAVPKATTNRRYCVRKLHPNPATGEPATFEEVPLAWAAIDFDKIPAPACLNPLDGMEAGAFLRDLLPDEFGDAACIVHATSSCGLASDLLNYRLWFLLSRPLMGAELIAWTSGGPIDPSTLRALELIYIARPLFVGMPDPVPQRLWMLPGIGERVEVPEVLPTREKQRAALGNGLAKASLGFDGYLAEMGDGPGKRRFRAPIVSAIAAYARAHGAEALIRTAEGVKNRIRQAIDAAPKERGRGKDLERYGSDRHLDELIQWCADRERNREDAARAGAIIAAVLLARRAAQ